MVYGFDSVNTMFGSVEEGFVTEPTPTMMDMVPMRDNESEEEVIVPEEEVVVEPEEEVVEPEEENVSVMKRDTKLAQRIMDEEDKKINMKKSTSNKNDMSSVKEIASELEDVQSQIFELSTKRDELITDLTEATKGNKDLEEIKQKLEDTFNDTIEGFKSNMKTTEPFVGSRKFLRNFLRTLLKAVLLGLLFFLMSTAEIKSVLLPVNKQLKKFKVSPTIFNVLVFVMLSYIVLIL